MYGGGGHHNFGEEADTGIKPGPHVMNINILILIILRPSQPPIQWV
jgi:hypothetical protein